MDVKEVALSVIECMTLGDFIITEGIVNAIYKFSHIALGKCRNPHDDWRNELFELHAKLVERGQIDKCEVG